MFYSLILGIIIVNKFIEKKQKQKVKQIKLPIKHKIFGLNKIRCWEYYKMDNVDIS